MSNIQAVQTELDRIETRAAVPGVRRLGTVATITLLLVAVTAGLAEIHRLPAFSADDFSSVLFGAG